MSRPTLDPGWQPYDDGRERYWDGERWQGEARAKGTDPILAQLRVISDQLQKIGTNLHLIGIMVVVWFILSILIVFGLITVEFRPL